MPLILAIEPDRRQANQLNAVVRGRLHAELVLADSAERALADLGNRIPDLILTSALLSPKDETALGERLRALDGLAAHVQTLTIPVLAMGKSRADGGGRLGVLSALRRDRTSTAVSQGCDPAVFAEQCRGYLDRAAAECERQVEEAALRAGQSETHVHVAAEPVADVRSEPAIAGIASAAAPPLDVETVAIEPLSVASEGASIEALPAAAAPIAAAEVEEVPIEDVAVEEPPVEEELVAGAQAEEAPVEEVLVEGAPAEDAPVEAVIEEARIEDAPVEAVLVDAVRIDEGRIEDARLEEQPIVVAQAAEAAPAAMASAPLDIPLATAAFEAVLREAERNDPGFLQFSCTPTSLVEAVVALEASESLARQKEARDELEYEIVDLDLSDLLDDPDKTPIRTLETRTFGRAGEDDEESVEVYEIGDIALDVESPLLAVEHSMPQVVPSIERAARQPIEQEPLATISETELYMPLPRAAAGSWPALEGFMDDVVALVAHETAQPVFTASTKNSEPEDVAEWLDIIEALRRDAEEVPFKRSQTMKRQTASEPAQSAEPGLAPPAAAAPPADSSQSEGPRRKRKRALGAPVQDEWGFFDPERCGFAALLAKLEEITDKDETPKPKRA